MNEPQWAPGPWRIEHDSSHHYFIYAKAPHATFEVCPARAHGLGEANLIAAAPDLYEALVAVVRIADRRTDEFDRARAALAKARGELCDK